MTETDRSILKFAGFAAGARKLTVGVPLTCEAMAARRRDKIGVVLLAADAAPGTKKRITDRTAFYSVPLVALSATAEELSAAIGKKDGLVMAVGVTEPHLAAEIRRLASV